MYYYYLERNIFKIPVLRNTKHKYTVMLYCGKLEVMLFWIKKDQLTVQVSLEIK